MRVVPLLLIWSACGSEELLLPEDPGAAGAPVGVRTYSFGDQVVEVWYPASDKAEAEPAVTDLAEFLPAEFLERLPEVDIPTLQTAALRDADPRRLEEALPVLLFSHGLGAFRTQSAALTTHLASRGYVVVSADHPGRMLGDVAPCLLSPPAGTCSIGALAGGDPAPEDLTDVLAWLDEGGPADLLDLLDLERLGIFGHSMGGGSAVGFANTELRVDAALAMAGAQAFTRELPSAVLAGQCDGVVPEAGLAESGATATDGGWTMPRVGHMAFSDLCQVDLGALAEQIGAREDASAFFVDMLSGLATDGCPGYAPPEEVVCEGGYRPIDETTVEINRAVTVFFDHHLSGAAATLMEAELPGVEALAP
jgi:dienelactone hydrolase